MKDVINVQKYYERISQVNNYLVKEGKLLFLKDNESDQPPLTWLLDLNVIAKDGASILENLDELNLEDFLINSHECKVSLLKLTQIETVFNLLNTKNFIFYSPLNTVLFGSKTNNTKFEGDFFVITFPVLEIHKYDLPGINPMLSSSLRKHMDRVFGYDHVFTLFNVVGILYAPWVNRQNKNVYDILLEKSSEAGAFKPLFKQQYDLSDI